MRQIIYLIALLSVTLIAKSQEIGNFTSLKPGAQSQILQIPASHSFQILVQTGIILPDGSIAQVFPDFTGYIGKAGSSTNGYLCINHEVVPGGVTVLEMNYNSTSKLWQLNKSTNVNFALLGGSGFNCSGGLTPWGTSITCEETYDNFPDANQDGYIDLGWSTEINPQTGAVVDQNGDGMPDKLWKLGRFKHENAAPHPNLIWVYQGADDSNSGFLYKFVADRPNKLSSGKLYALKMDTVQNGEFSKTGRWIQIPNNTPSECNMTQTLASQLGATNFARIEDVEVGPDGLIYFTSTSAGNIYRLSDLGDSINSFETYVSKGDYLINHGEGSLSYKFEKCDNLAFDCEGNLWVTEDGSKFHIWVIGAGHSAQNPDVRLFMTTPLSADDPSGNISGAEPTGISFSPDCKFLFLSLQRCGNNNTQTQSDATGVQVRFDRDATLVVARRENLGSANSIANQQQDQLTTISPNPAKEFVHLSFNATTAKDVQFILMDPLGRIISDQNFRTIAGTNTIKVDTFVFPAGLYRIQVRDGVKLLLNEKLVIE